MKLRELMEKSGLTQQKVAYDLRISPQAVSHYITGRREPDFETLIRIANYFNVSTDYLLGRDVPDETDRIRVSCIEIGDKRIALDDEDVKLHVNGSVITIHVEAER